MARSRIEAIGIQDPANGIVADYRNPATPGPDAQDDYPYGSADSTVGHCLLTAIRTKPVTPSPGASFLEKGIDRTDAQRKGWRG